MLLSCHVLFGTRAPFTNCLVHETSVTRYGISKSTYPLERFQKPRYVPRDSGRKVPEDAGRTVAKQRGMRWGSVLRRWRMHSNGSRDKEQDQCDSQLSPGLWTRFSHVVLTLLWRTSWLQLQNEVSHWERSKRRRAEPFFIVCVQLAKLCIIENLRQLSMI